MCKKDLTIEEIANSLKDEKKIGEYRSIPFWSWNGKLDNKKLTDQILWMKEQGFGGYFMHARSGLTTEYLGDEWFDAVSACADAGEELGMQCWAYDENGWPSGFVGGKLLKDISNRDESLSYMVGEFDKTAFVSYIIDDNKIIRTDKEGDGIFLNIYKKKSNSTVDILNPEVTGQFLKLTHEEYKKRLGNKFKKLKGFFTDEPQYYRWAHPYTEMLPKAFMDKYGVDILDNLGLIFVEKEGYKEFRYRYWKTMQELMLKNFSEKVYNWCNDNGIKLTGHYIEEATLYWQILCCGGIMPYYEYEHIPGIDNLGRNVPNPVVPKQVSSVACQLGKKQVLTETFACCGWDVTPVELKIIAEGQYVNGVNLMCQHLLPYSEYGQRKRDYPAHFSAVNPWIKKDFKPFNDYFAKLGYLLGESKEIVSVAVFCPIASIYFDYKRYEFDVFNTVNDSYRVLTKKLSKMNIEYHIIDETIMGKHAKVDANTLIVGNCKYDCVIFPEVVTMGVSTEKIFDEYYNGGGKMLFTGSKFTYLEGTPHEFVYESNITLDKIKENQPYRVSNDNTEIQSSFREINGKKFIYAVNTSFEKDYEITFSGDFNGFVKLDLETLETKKSSNIVNLSVGESAVLFISDEETEKENQDKIITLNGSFEVKDGALNYLVLDKLCYSLDGVNYSEELSHMGVFNELLNIKYSGEAYLKYCFTVKEKPEKISFLAEDNNIISLTVNGKKVDFTGKSEVEEKLIYADISSAVKIGENEAVLKIYFFESDKVYYVLFGENIDESLKNCLAYDTTIEACFLKGDFGVYSDSGFTRGKEKNVYLGDDFYVGKAKKIIENPIEDGYPFFSGKITLRKKFTVEDKKVKLKLNGNYSLCELKINDLPVKKSYFTNLVNISNFVTEGENKAEITLYISNRNLLGPHHYLPEEEPLGVGPGTFELPNTWKNGKSSDERDNYSFVRFGLFDKY